MRLLEKVGNPHLVVVHRIIESCYRIRNFRNEDHEQEDMGDVKLPRSAQNLRRSVERALQGERPTVNKGGGIPRDEDEDFRRIIELECLQGEIAENVLWNVIDKDENKSETAKKVEAEI